MSGALAPLGLVALLAVDGLWPGRIPAAGVLGLGCVLALVCAIVPPRSGLGRALLGAALLFAVLRPLAFELPASMPPSRGPGVRGLLALAAIDASAYLCTHLRGSFRRVRFWGLVALYLVLALALGVPPLAGAACVAAAGLLGRAGSEDPAREVAAAVLLFGFGLAPLLAAIGRL